MAEEGHDEQIGVATEKREVIEVPKEAYDFFDGDEIRARVFYEKYALKGDNLNPVEKSPVELWSRIARELSSVEADDAKKQEWYEKFTWLLQDFRFVPGGRILFGAGQKRRATLLNCYVIAVKEDSLEAIFDWCREAARTYSLGGGVGTDISVLRPKGAPVNNSATHSSGAVSFMEIMSETTHTISQENRRGALMITLSVDHPDVLEFIKIKQNVSKVRYANISLRITDEFMRAVEANKEFALHFENEKVKRIERKIMAREIWSEIVKSARDWAEPGIIFWDTMKRYSPSEYNGMEIITTNPCSEQPLQDMGACDLGALNLSNFVLDPFTDDARLDWETLEKATRYSMRLLDNVLDYNSHKHPLRAQAEAVGKSRRTGLGVMGLGDMLTKLRVKYDTDEALQFVDKLFEGIKNWAYDASTEIAKEKGAFSLFDKEKHLSMPFVQQLNEKVREKIARYGLRNVALLTIAPTGTTSVLAGVSSGIEPIFAFSYTRRSETMSKEYYKVFHPLVMQYMKLANLQSESELPEFFMPAHKINAEFRVRLQGVIQRHIDSAISSTVNLPREATAEEVGNIYMLAWKAGCKGITVYREGSREGILITEEQERRLEKREEAKPLEEWSRPQLLSGKTIKLQLPQGSLYVTANIQEGNGIKEVFINMGSVGSQEKSWCEALGKLISKYLQAGGGVESVIDGLRGIRANDSISWYMGLKLYSVPDAIAKALEVAAGFRTLKASKLLAGEAEKSDGYIHGQQLNVISGGEVKPETCPECGEHTLVHESGCYVCKNCGYTKCA